MQHNTFITGCSSGIGLALAQSCLGKEQRVYGISRRKPEELKSHPHFFWRAVNLADLDVIGSQLTGFLNDVTELDLVILNAGVLGPLGDLTKTLLNDMKRVVDVNVWANKVLLDHLFALEIPIRQVVAISSGASIHAGRGWNAYSISKAALNMIIGLYAAEQPDTHFCALAPGIIDTGMQDQISQLPNHEDFSSFERLKAAKGTEAMPKPQEAAEKILNGIEMALGYDSCSFLDVRELV